MALNIFQCTPVSLAWTGWDEKHEGHCVDLRTMGCAQAAINMLFDLFILAMPMPTLYRLNTTLKKKIQVLAMFSLGLFVVVICILRLAYLIIDINVINVTWITWSLGLWDAAEAYVSIICGCLPSAKTAGERAFARCFPRGCFGSQDDNRQYPCIREASSNRHIVKRTSTIVSK